MKKLEQDVMDYEGLAHSLAKRIIPKCISILEAKKEKMPLKEASNFFQRTYYHFLKDNGFKKGRGYSGYRAEFAEIPVSDD